MLILRIRIRSGCFFKVSYREEAYIGCLLDIVRNVVRYAVSIDGGLFFQKYALGMHFKWQSVETISQLTVN